MASSRCAVDEATPRYRVASVNRISGCSPNSSSSFNALSTDSIGYCGASESVTDAPTACRAFFCMTETVPAIRDEQEWHSYPMTVDALLQSIPPLTVYAVVGLVVGIESLGIP